MRKRRQNSLGVHWESCSYEGVGLRFLKTFYSILEYMAQTVKSLSAIHETWLWYLVREDLLEKGKATHSSILTWRIPRTEEPAGLWPNELQRVGHDWVTNTHTHTQGLNPGLWQWECGVLATELPGDSFCFYFLGNVHAVFHSDCTSVHSHQPCRRVTGTLLYDSYWNWAKIFADTLPWYVGF